jgi:hypothetical protein
MQYCYYIPYDLHVLAMPPAFVLSQDQTLRFDFRMKLATLSSRPSNSKFCRVTGPGGPLTRAQTFVCIRECLSLPILMNRQAHQSFRRLREKSPDVGPCNASRLQTGSRAQHSRIDLCLLVKEHHRFRDGHPGQPYCDGKPEPGNDTGRQTRVNSNSAGFSTGRG